jgi:hypothetical protein
LEHVVNNACDLLASRTVCRKKALMVFTGYEKVFPAVFMTEPVKSLNLLGKGAAEA